MSICKSCGRPIPSDATKCPFCGETIAENETIVAFCRTCGAPIDPKTKRCRICGNDAKTAAAEEPSPAAETAAPTAGPFAPPAEIPQPGPAPAPGPAFTPGYADLPGGYEPVFAPPSPEAPDVEPLGSFAPVPPVSDPYSPAGQGYGPAFPAEPAPTGFEPEQPGAFVLPNTGTGAEPDFDDISDGPAPFTPGPDAYPTAPGHEPASNWAEAAGFPPPSAPPAEPPEKKKTGVILVIAGILAVAAIAVILAVMLGNRDGKQGNTTTAPTTTDMPPVSAAATTMPDEASSTEKATATTAAETITIPDFLGKSYSQIATDAYYSQFLIITSTEEFSDSYAAGTIISQSLKKGEIVQRGTRLNLTVSKGSEYVYIPNVLNATYEQALKALTAEDVGLVVKKVLKANEGNHKQNTVESTSPMYGSRVRRGSEITVTVWDKPMETEKPTVHVTAVELRYNGTRINGANLYADKGEIFTLTAVVTPKDADDQSVTWSSDNSAVASVDASGKVSVRGYGSAGITVRTVDGNYSAWVTVVVEQPEPPTAAPPASLSVDNAYFSSYSASGNLSSYARVELQGISASGDTVTANFMLCNCEGLTSGDVVLRYDSSVLQCTGYSDGSDAAAIQYDRNKFYQTTDYSESGKIYFSFYFLEELYEQGGWDTYVNSSQFHACTLTFRIKDSRVSATDAVAALMATAYLQ